VPETFFTVWTNLFDRGGCKPAIPSWSMAAPAHWDDGDPARRSLGSQGVRHGRQRDKARFCERLGAVRASTTTARISSPCTRGNRGRGVDLILDIVGANYLARNFEAAAVEGRVVVSR